MIILTLPYPISANRYWGTRVIKLKATGKWASMTYVTPEAEQYRQDVAKIARDAGAFMLPGRLGLHLRLFPHRPLDWRARQRKLGEWWDDTVQCIDLGNAEKVLSDALEGVVYENDKALWRQFKERMEPDGDGARVVIAIEQLPRPVVQASLLEVA